MIKETQLQKRINSRIIELINSGSLIEEDGVNNLCAQLIQEFPEAKLGKKGIKQRIKNLVWNKNVDKALQEVVRRREDPKEVFIHLYPYIPLDMVLKRARYHHGITKVRAKGKKGSMIPGIGRGGIDMIPKELKKFKMPSATFDKPFKINVNDPENWSIMFLNGSNIGTLHGGDIVGNVTRRALSDANEREDAAIIATNIIALDLLKTAGPSSLKRSLSFGDNVDPEDIKDSERREIIKRIIEEEPMNELIFVTAEERINSILNGWTKICIKPDRKPEYRGPTYIILGNNEDQIIRSIAYWEMAWWKVVKEDELSHKLSMTKTARIAAEKRGDFKLAEELAEQIKIIRYQLQLAKMTNIDTPERHRFYRYAKGLVVKKIEEAIPNSKVIGQDISYLEIAGKKIEVNIPPHNKVTDTLLADYADKYGPKNLLEKLADLVVICHPWTLQFRMTVREADYNGERGSTKVMVAPVAADESYLRETLSSSSSQGHPFARAVLSDGFRSGVLRLDCVSGLVDADVLSTPSLEAFKEYPRKRRKSRNSIYDRSSKYMWFMFGADPHYGGRAKEFVTSAESGKRLGMAEAVFEMMRRDGLCKNENMRVHLFATPDDQTQGHHFKARVQPDPEQLSPDEIENKSQELAEAVKKARNKQERSDALDRLTEFHNRQIEKRGSDFPLHQIQQVMKRNIESNVDVYRSILRCSERSGLVIRGIGEFINPRFGGFDSRNPGRINIGSGNHFSRTVEEEVVEGPLFATLLRALLSGYPEWRNRSEELEKAVVAPLYSGEFISWGTVQIPGGHEYGLELRSSPTRMQGWGDTLLGATRNLPTRGNYTKIFNKKLPILSVCGDKHYFGAVITSYAFHHMCGSGTHTDRFGERGFPPNNTGVSFIGLPVDGPDSGPMLVRLLPIDVIKDFVQVNPRSLDWETFLPNPA